jgi:hypothetical protein
MRVSEDDDDGAYPAPPLIRMQLSSGSSSKMQAMAAMMFEPSHVEFIALNYSTSF